MLGVLFDTSLYMTQAVLKLSEVANWKVRTILRTKRYYNRDESMNLYKSHVLEFIEYRTAAIYHCAENLLQQIDLVQKRVCKAMEISTEDALNDCKLAPLTARRDIAMLGLIHRAIIGVGPEHFRQYFRRIPNPARPSGRENIRRHNKQLQSHRNGKFLQLLSNSVLGLVDIYNLLPQYVVDATTVKLFQHRLQELMKVTISKGVGKWDELFSPRRELHCHELRKWQDWVGTGIPPT